ncbi:ABC transporter ATP-binding protein [Gluconobacter thailandicus]|uniref:ABC transporter ATP-binding protein n=1 Tax=Gluconobacter thailandicus TaxID=257438 RepID=A0AAP9JH10_GLUTH|nr:ABC transporter ATP-binding protein [Gluconobacter thailandicus]QEH94909.1 ABC transporter ATP-binding protein [Gluconobacter thailandicus]
MIPQIPNPVIQVKNAGHWFTPSQWLFRNLGFTVNEGEITAILGPNGRGKTTLLKAISQSLHLREGLIEVESGPPGIVPQAAGTVSFSVLEMVLLGRSQHIGRFSSPSRKDYEKARKILHRLGLSELELRRFDHLSGGQKQLVLLARALACESRALILDEPGSALDLANQKMLLQTLRQLAIDDNLAILFTTHDPQHALAIADNVLMLLGSNDVIRGKPCEVFTEYSLEKLYGIKIHCISVDNIGKHQIAILPHF